MSFFGSTTRYSHGVGVVKLLEDRGEDWWHKNLTSMANAVKGEPLSTGGSLVSSIVKQINPIVTDKFGHLFKGRINRSFADEKLLAAAVTDPCFVKVLDYAIGIEGEAQGMKYLQDTYGVPSYGPCGLYIPTWIIDGKVLHFRSIAFGYSGVYPDLKQSSIDIRLSECYSTNIVKTITIPYSTDPVCMIVYKSSCPVSTDEILVDNDDVPLVDDSGAYLATGKQEVQDEFVWYVDAKDVVIEKYADGQFMVMDYKRRGAINRSKYIYVMNTRLTIGNAPDPCSGQGFTFNGIGGLYNPGYGGSSNNKQIVYKWSTTVSGEVPEEMFTVDTSHIESAMDCQEHKAKMRSDCLEANGKDPETDWLDGFGDSAGIVPGLMGGECSDAGDGPSTLRGIISEEENKTVLLVHAVGYTDDEKSDQYKYREILDELLDVSGKYNSGFKPTSAKGKKAKSNFRGKGLGGYIVYVHDIEIAYVDYFVTSRDENDYGTIDKGLGFIGKDEKVARQCETRDELTGYSMVIDRYPLRTVDNDPDDDDGGCKKEFNDTKVQYMLPLDWMWDRTMVQKYRDVKETMCLIIQATKVRELEWYETGLFKLVMIIVSFYLMGPWAFLALTALGVLLDHLDIHPYLKLAIQLAVGMMMGDFSSLISASNIMNIVQQIATVYMAEYVKSEMQLINEEAEEVDKEAKATKKALAKMKRDALYSPLDEIDESFDMQFDLLYNSYGMATSTEAMVQLDKKGIE